MHDGWAACGFRLRFRQMWAAIVSSLDWGRLGNRAAPSLRELLGGLGRLVLRTGQQAHVVADQGQGQPFDQLTDGIEALVLFERDLVHVEVAADLDLHRVDAVLRPAGGPGYEAAGIGPVAREAQAGA